MELTDHIQHCPYKIVELERAPRGKGYDYQVTGYPDRAAWETGSKDNLLICHTLASSYAEVP